MKWFPATLPCLLLLAMLLPGQLTAQQPETGPTFEFQTPKAWRGEVIALPPGFAKDLAWKGVENIRFAPGMFKAEHANFFSYVLVFLLDKDADVSEAAVKKQVLVYYQGLAQAVAGKVLPDLDTDAFELELKAADELKPNPGGDKVEGMKTWAGTLDWIEPFATKKAQTLNLEVHVWKHEEQPALYFTVSPQATDHAIWKEMRDYRKGFTFGKAKEE